MPEKPDFSSSRRMLGWANKNITDLEREVSTYLSTNPYKIFPEVNHDGLTRLVAQFSAYPPDDIDRHAIEVARNLRAALDQAAWVTAVASGKSGKSGTHFPFPHSSSEDHIRDVRRKGSKEIPEEIFSFFLSFKPYPGGG